MNCGRWARNDLLVGSWDEGGLHGDPYHGITIRDGFFSVEEFGGSGWRWNYVVTFKYDKLENNWFLWKTSNEVWHLSTPKEIETTTKTTNDFGVVKFSDYRNPHKDISDAP